MIKKILLIFFIFLQLQFSIFAQTNQNDPMNLYYEGYRLLQNGDYFSAIDNFKKSLSKNKYYLEAFLGIAEAYYYLDEYDEALAYINDAKKLNSNDSRTLNLEGRVLLALGNVAQSKVIFDKILLKEPHNIDAMIGRANFFLSKGNVHSALRTYLGGVDTVGAYKVAPNDKRVLLSLALLYDDEGKSREALKYVKEAIDAAPYDYLVYSIASELFYKNKDIDKASEYIDIALKYNPNDKSSLLTKSYIEIDKNNFPLAMESLNRLISIDKGNVYAMYTMAELLNKMGNYSDSIAYLTRALSLNSNDEISRLLLKNDILTLYRTDIKAEERKNLAKYYKDEAIASIRKNYYLNALINLKDALELDPADPELMSMKANIVLTQGYISRFLSESKVVLDEFKKQGNLTPALQRTKTSIEDKKETYETLNRDNVSAKWDKKLDDQFLEIDDAFSFNIYYIKNNDKLLHLDAQKVLTSYMKKILGGFPNISFSNYDNMKLNTFNPKEVKSFAEAFKDAQVNHLDYFLMVNFAEDDLGTFSSSSKLYLARTGRRLNVFDSYKSGNFKVQNTFYELGRNISNILPYRGRILKIEFDKALINLGKMDGLKVGDRLSVLKDKDLLLERGKVGITYDKDKLIANLEITKLDDKVAEVKIRKVSIIDRVSVFDKVVLNKQNTNFDRINRITKMIEEGNVKSLKYRFPMIYTKLKRIR